MSDHAGPGQVSTDQIGAVVEVATRCCDALVVSHPIADLVTAVLRDAEYPPPARLGGMMLPPVITTDVGAAVDEASALAADGVRVVVVGRGRRGRQTEPGNLPRPCVHVRTGVSASDHPVSRGPVLTPASAQQAIDLCLIAHRVAELALQTVNVELTGDIDLSTFDTVDVPDLAVLSEFLGRPSDEIDTPTSYQQDLFGASRRRIPDAVSADADTERLASDVQTILGEALSHFASLTGRTYASVDGRVGGDTPVNETGLNPAHVVVVSTRAYSVARMMASVCAAHGQVKVTGPAGSQNVGIVTGTLTEEGRDVDVVVAPGRPGAKLLADLTRLRSQGVLVLEAQTSDAEGVWQNLPESVRLQIRERELRVFAVCARSTDGLTDYLFEEAASDLVLDFCLSGQTVGSNGRAAGAQESDAKQQHVFELAWSEYQTGPDFYAQDPSLRMPDIERPEPSDEMRRRLVNFHNTGQHVGSRIDDAGLVPVSLFPFVSSGTVRGPFPVLVPTEPSGKPVALSHVSDSLSDGEASSPESSRAILKLEAALVEEFTEAPEADISDLWDRAAGRLAAAGSSAEATEEAAGTQVSELRKRLAESRLMAFGPATSIAILKRAIDREWSQRFTPIREDASALAVMMEEFLRADFSGSDEGRDPDHLEAAIGKGYAQELDFEALSQLVGTTQPSEPLPEHHRVRLESTAADLRDLPARLSNSEQEGVLQGAEGLTQSIARAHENLRTVASLVRAVRVALLESSGSYREQLHDKLFARFGVEHLSAEERALCPPCIVDLGTTSTLSRSMRGALMEVLSSDLPIKAVVSVDRLPTGLRDGTENDPSAVAAAALATQALGLDTAFVLQAPASELDAFVDGAAAGARYHGPALYSLYYGGPTTVHDPTGYLASAVALESRAFPLIRFDPSGADWAGRIRIDGNPDADSAWGHGEISYAGSSGDGRALSTSFTFADYLSLDPKMADHFRALSPDDWQPEMIALDDFLDLDEAEATERIPYIWMTDESGALMRVVVTYPVSDAARAVQRRWRTLQELGGVKSSFAERIATEERERLDREREAIETDAQQQIRTELDRATGEVAREIVSNIAAGLLGLRPMTGAAPIPTPVRVEAQEAVVEAEPEEPIAEATEEPEEEEALTLDEPYIETPRCTTCNECTNLNSRMFAYDQNKQAYIKDASAGTFRELVVAAEKCPVRIIHPGKPLITDEPGLEELIKRAQPFQ